jgi:DNA-binding protein H-NS
MQSFEQIQAQIAAITAKAQADVADLQKQAAAARKEASAAAIKEIKRLMTENNLTAADLGLSGAGKAAKAKIATGDKRAAVAPKYRDNETGQTWTGRGKAPTWLAAKMAAGASKESFRI